MDTPLSHRLLRGPAHHILYRYPLVWLLLAVVCGLQLSYLLKPWHQPILFVAIPVLILLTAWSGVRRQLHVAAGLALASTVLLSAIYAYAFRPPDSDDLALAALRSSQSIGLRAVVNSVAEWRPNPSHRPTDPQSEAWETSWGVDCVAVRNGSHWQPIQARCDLIASGRIDDYLPGDEIQVFGSFRSIPPASNPGAFDYAAHAKELGQFVHLSADDSSQIRRVATGQQYPLQRLRGHVVRMVDRSLRRWVTLDQAPLAAALVFGQRTQVEWDDQQELMATGTLHLLAISGMHLGIVAAATVVLCSLLSTSNLTEFVAVTCVCALYAGLAGGQPPVVRAAVLVTLVALARVAGRRTRLANLLSLAAIVILLVQTANLGNVGVHLSFLAVGSIGLLGTQTNDRAERRSILRSVIEDSYHVLYRRWLRVLRGLWISLRLSAWVWLMTCPVIWTHFHVIAPIAIPLNLLIAIPLLLSLLFGLLTGLSGWLPPVAWCAGQVTGWSLASIAWMVAVGKTVPFGHVWLPSPPLWWTVSFYIFAVIWLIWFGLARRLALAMCLLVWIGLGMGLFSCGPRGFLGIDLADHLSPPNVSVPAKDEQVAAELRCTFLDVGHGTSVIIEYPTGEVWLYDAGHLGAASRSHEQIASALWSLPTARMERLILSHADADHYNATGGLLERFRIGSIVSTQRFWESTAAEVRQVHEAIDNAGVRRVVWHTSDKGTVAKVDWQVLHPRNSLASESDNASSLCLLLQYAGRRILLPGDLEGSGLLGLVELPQRPCDVLMAPHHGSLALDPRELLSWCQPEIVVISGNHRATRPEVQQQYTFPSVDQLGITFRDGAVQVRISDTGELSCWHWNLDHWASMPSMAREDPL